MSRSHMAERLPVPVGEMPAVPAEYGHGERCAYARGWNDCMCDRDKGNDYRRRSLADAYDRGYDECHEYWQRHRVRACDREAA